MKLSDRYTVESLTLGSTDAKGHLFFNDFGIADLSNVTVVGASVDTVRQLFYGTPESSMVDYLQTKLEQKDDSFEFHQYFEHLRKKSGDSSSFFGYGSFHLAKMGKVARYRYKLQNNQAGVVILFGSYYETLDKEGQHLKIELSPKFISSHSVQSTMQYLYDMASFFTADGVAKGCAVHLACDYQGFTLPANFLDSFSTRSTTIKSYDGLSTIDLSNLSEAVATYGSTKQERNYLIGKPNSIQLAIYDKSYEAIKSDKVDYFHDEWTAYTMGMSTPEHPDSTLFDPLRPVRRIEYRFHHQVIREIGLGLGVELESFDEVSRYLTDLWRYALKNSRLNIQAGSDILHPFWQLLMQDVQFYAPSQNIKVTRKKKQAVDPIARNITCFLGNLISISARTGLTANDVFSQIKMLHIYPDIIKYYQLRGLSVGDLKQTIEKGLLLRRLIGKAA